MYQIGILFAICWVSQIVESILPFAFPASVIGMALLFALLCTHKLRIGHIREKSDFLLENMAFFFVPAGVSIVNYFDALRSSLLPLLLICLVTTVVTFAVTAYSIRLTLLLMGRGKRHD